MEDNWDREEGKREGPSEKVTFNPIPKGWEGTSWQKVREEHSRQKEQHAHGPGSRKGPGLLTELKRSQQHGSRESWGNGKENYEMIWQAVLSQGRSDLCLKGERANFSNF